MTADFAVRRLRLVELLLQLPDDRLDAVERYLLGDKTKPQIPGENAGPFLVAESADVDWPHAPPHRLSTFGIYFVTTGTLRREHHFSDGQRLDHFQRELLRRMKQGRWQLEAWAIFSNHYHIIVHALEKASPLSEVLRELHRTTAIYVNELDGQPGRQVWFNYRDTALTHETSYFARLAYTHNNPVKHGLAANASLYPWCSAGWLERTATSAQVATLARIKTDSVNVYDDYAPLLNLRNDPAKERSAGRDRK